jgi:hypothetical protein
VNWRGTCLISGVNYSRLAFPAAAIVALFFTGCSSVSRTVQKVTAPSGDGKFFTVTADSAAFFRRGPQPGRQPDKTLSKDTLVRLVRPSFGFSKVQLVASGELGYVASDEIKPASSTLVASTTTARTNSAVSPPAHSAVEQFNLNSNDPRLVPPPEELPDPDLPAPSPGQ